MVKFFHQFWVQMLRSFFAEVLVIRYQDHNGTIGRFSSQLANCFPNQRISIAFVCFVERGMLDQRLAHHFQMRTSLRNWPQTNAAFGQLLAHVAADIVQRHWL
ncbi:hypothetical protein MMAG44476_39375 [Mycolicibacterium mageritense DSM 44476 = CIP 104973]